MRFIQSAELSDFNFPEITSCARPALRTTIFLVIYDYGEHRISKNALFPSTLGGYVCNTLGRFSLSIDTELLCFRMLTVDEICTLGIVLINKINKNF